MIDYALINLTVYAVFDIDGVSMEVRDVVGFNSTFAINTIPSATLTLATGALANSLSDPPIAASINTLGAQVQDRVKVKVYLTSLVLDSMGVQRNTGGVNVATTSKKLADIGVPEDGTLLIFEGNVAGIGRSVSSSGTAVAAIYIEHWMANLNYASAISASSSPGNQNDMVFSATIRAQSTLPASGRQDNIITWVPTVEQASVNSTQLSDIWGLVLHKWIASAVEQDPFATEAGNALQQPLVADVAPIRDAVERLRLNDNITLGIDADGADRAAIQSGIRESLIMQTGTNWVNTTIWGKLVEEWSPTYRFSVIPRVSDGLIVPFTGPLSGEPWAVIGNEDYVFVQTDFRIPQKLRGVGIVHPAHFSTGLDLTPIGVLDITFNGFAGQYLSTSTKTGMLLVKTAPVWLTDPIDYSSGSGNAEGIDSPVQTGVDGPAGGGDAAQNAALAARIVGNRSFLSKYAQQWYALENLKGRTGEVAGKLRFDICPGSNVLLESDSQAATNLIEDTYGTVLQVSYSFDAEKQQAGTSFVISHIHTSAEHSDSDAVVDKPPMYTTTWKGAVMVPNITPEPRV